MPSKTKKAAAAAKAAVPSTPKELIDQFVTGPMSAEAVNAAVLAAIAAFFSFVLLGILAPSRHLMPHTQKSGHPRADPRRAWQARVIRCVGLQIISTTRRRGIFTSREEPSGKKRLHCDRRGSVAARSLAGCAL